MPENLAPDIGMLPEPQLLSGILLDVIAELDVADEYQKRWPLYGVKFTPRQFGRPLISFRSAYDCADRPPLEPQEYPFCLPTVEQFPFGLVDVVRMTALEWMANGEDQIDAEALARFQRLVSAGFAKQLLTASDSRSISLSNSATAPTGLAFGTAAGLVKALSLLESELSRRLLNSRGMIHLPPVLLAQAVEEYALSWNGSSWVTPLGNRVVVDAGYNDAPAPTGGGDAAGATEVWVYASGDVWYKSTTGKLSAREGGAAFLSDDAGFTDRIERWTEGYGLLVFEPSLVTAAQVNQTP